MTITEEILITSCLGGWRGDCAFKHTLDLKVNVYKAGFIIKGKGWRRKKLFVLLY